VPLRRSNRLGAHAQAFRKGGAAVRTVPDSEQEADDLPDHPLDPEADDTEQAAALADAVSKQMLSALTQQAWRQP
jgi:hypothetical protein